LSNVGDYKASEWGGVLKEENGIRGKKGNGADAREIWRGKIDIREGKVVLKEIFVNGAPGQRQKIGDEEGLTIMLHRAARKREKKTERRALVSKGVRRERKESQNIQGENKEAITRYEGKRKKEES